MLETTTDILIQTENLCKVFKGKRGLKVQALDHVSFAVQKGEIFGFLGPNGAGKSTTIKTLMGLIRPSSGRALLCGKDSNNVAARVRVGYLPENPVFYDFLTGREYLKFVATTFQMDPAEIGTAIEIVLERLDLSAAAGRPIKSYSKGMVQRLGLAQALLHDPDTYVLDEPMSGLDPQGRALVKEIIQELGARGKTVFFSTHITNDVEKICDRLAIITQGRLQVVARVDDVLSSGIEGYRILVRGDVSGCIVSQPYESRGESEHEFRVAPEVLSRLIGEINHKGATVEFVEPLRQDLEKYFLDIVNQASA